MTNTELELYKRLQPFLKWIPQIGDRVFHDYPDDGELGIVVDTLIEEDKEYWTIEVHWGARLHTLKNKLCLPSWFWLPLPIDPINPERGLWGMLAGQLSLANAEGWICRTGIGTIKVACHYADTPTEAILKALCEQEGL